MKPLSLEYRVFRVISQLEMFSNIKCYLITAKDLRQASVCRVSPQTNPVTNIQVTKTKYPNHPKDQNKPKPSSANSERRGFTLETGPRVRRVTVSVCRQPTTNEKRQMLKGNQSQHTCKTNLLHRHEGVQSKTPSV